MDPAALANLAYSGLQLLGALVQAAVSAPSPLATPADPGPFRTSAYCQLVEGSFGAPSRYTCPAPPVCFEQDSDAEPETSRVVECSGAGTTRAAGTTP